MLNQNVPNLRTVPNSVLFLGRPGVGKTTVVREMARVLADDLHKRVVIVDTSNEIGGDGDVRPLALSHAYFAQRLGALAQLTPPSVIGGCCRRFRTRLLEALGACKCLTRRSSTASWWVNGSQV